MPRSVLDEIEVLIRSRYPILNLITWEEEKAERLLAHVAERLRKKVVVWSRSEGFREDLGVVQTERTNVEEPVEAIRQVMSSAERAIFVLHDFHTHLDDPLVVRHLRDAARKLSRSYKSLVLVGPVMKIPEELEKDIAVVDVPLPTEAEIASILKTVLDAAEEHPDVSISKDPLLTEQVIQAAKGLTEKEAERVFAKAVVDNHRFGEEDIQLILEEKKQLIRKIGILDFYDLAENMSLVGGLSGLKKWLQLRSEAFSERARQYGLPEPKGLLLLGVQGCGKSLTAKAVASHWKLPLLRLDVGSLFSSYIGQSEANMRKAIKLAEGLAPVVVWMDEIEKGFSGTTDVSSSDSGTTKRVFASFLTWMQEKTEPVFVIATANSIRGLPPELLRKGRFDEIFFVDLPKEIEREEIFRIHLAKRKREAERFEVGQLARESNGFSGAEIEEAIVSAMYDAFAEGREVESRDVLGALAATVPLSATMAEEIQALRDWAANRTRPASG